MEADLSSVTIIQGDVKQAYSGNEFMIVFSPGGTLLWGHELLQAVVEVGKSVLVQKIIADKVIATYSDGTAEVMTEAETKTFDGSRWQTYWRKGSNPVGH